MAFNIGIDPNSTNAALSKLGYDYQLPTTTSIAPSAATGTTAPMAAQPPPPPPAPAAPATPTNDPGAPAPEKEEGGTSGVQQAGQMIEGISKIGGTDERSNKAFQKVGALVGTILSAYTGNAAGVAGGVGAMKNAQK